MLFFIEVCFLIQNKRFRTQPAVYIRALYTQYPMSISDRIQSLVKLAEAMQESEVFSSLLETVHHQNPWFVTQFTNHMANAVCSEYLEKHKLEEFTAHYHLVTPVEKQVAIVMAGNVPLVGMHDFICCWLAGCNMQLKLSGKDDRLFTEVLKLLIELNPSTSQQVRVVNKIENFDAVIATGSDNTHRYFEYYFRNYPSILRKNRNAVAVLHGCESSDQLQALADDVLLYFGLGCRNVSKLMLPEGYKPESLFPHFEKYRWMYSHTRFMNNYDYQRTLLMLNHTPHLANEILMMRECEALTSPIATLHYAFYKNTDDCFAILNSLQEQIQCVVADEEHFVNRKVVGFGKAQSPSLFDYADGADTMQFLLSL